MECERTGEGHIMAVTAESGKRPGIMLNRWWQELRRSSLRFLYWTASSVMVVLLVVGAYNAHRYIEGVSGRNARDLETQQQIIHALRDIRDALWQAETELNNTLIKPRIEHPEKVEDHLQTAARKVDGLRTMSLPPESRLDAPLTELAGEIAFLRKRVEELLSLRHDIEWVYPMLPFIDRHMRELHESFMTAAQLALAEVADMPPTQANFRLMRKLERVKSLWASKVLDFRALVIRFAGLNERRYLSQEQNIMLLQQRIDTLLDELAAMGQTQEFGLQTEESLAEMRELSKNWFQRYQQFRALRDSNIWRNDLHYVQTRIRPLQTRINQLMHRLDDDVTAWSARNAAGLQNATTQLTMEIWIFLLLAVGFILFIYVLVDHAILKPIQSIALQIAGEGQKREHLSLDNAGSREIQILVDAYNHMRREIHQRQTALEHQAMHDTLTGLPNRALLQDRLEQAMHLAHRQHTRMVFILMDLDRFKEINDTLGHPVGDQVLQQISRRLAGNLRESDTVARLGGDEFAIVAIDLQGAEVQAFLEKIVHIVSEVIRVEGQDLFVGASLGVALYPDHGEDAATLIRRADIAMYRAKRNRRDYVIYDPSFDEHSIDNLSLLGDLRMEMKQPSGALHLHYQPQVLLQTNEIRWVEALLRWQHPRQGFVSPEDVIRLAEQSGLMNPLTHLVLQEAIADCAGWQARHPDVGVAVNLSAWDLQDADLPEYIRQLLEEYGLPASRLTLEITESGVMNDPLRAREVMTRLHRMGASLAIDDYGTGFSSLAYLKLLPVDSLKIDRSFVIDMLEDENDAIIVRSTIELSHNLGLKVVAEGVENAEVLELLRAHGCDSAQGYHLARPMPLSRLMQWLNGEPDEMTG